MNVMQIDLSGYGRIAHATSETDSSRRWTALSLYYRPASLGQTFVAVVVGGSRIAGDEPREQRRAAATINGAMSLFDEESRLTTKLIYQVERWQAEHPNASAIAAHVAGQDEALAELLAAARACATELLIAENRVADQFEPIEGDDDPDGWIALAARVKAAAEAVEATHG